MSPIIPGIPASDGRQPDTPTVGTASAGNASASVPFTAPTYLGKPNTPLTYRAFTQPVTVRSTTGTIANVTQLGSVWRADITGMSSVTNLFVNQIITATAGTGSLGAGTVTIKAIPTSSSIIIESTATMTPGTITNILGGIFGTNTTPPITVSGLTNGTAYTFRINLDNAVATSLPTPPSNSVTPVLPPPPIIAVPPPIIAVTPPIIAVTPPIIAVTPPIIAVTPPIIAVTPPIIAVTPPIIAVTPPIIAAPPPFFPPPYFSFIWGASP